MNILAIFGISVLMSIVSYSVAARLYVWPRLRVMEPNRALAPLVTLHFLRFVGLSFMVPGVVSATLPAGFAIPAGYGDLVALILAIVAMLALVTRASWAIAAVWVFNVWGTTDLLFAFYQAGHLGVQPGEFGASFFLVTAVVPALLVTHALIFRILVRREPSRAV